MLGPLTLMLDHRRADLGPAPLPDVGRALTTVRGGRWAGELSPHVLLEGLFMVAAGIRPSSFHHPSSEREVALIHDAARALSLGMRVRLAGRGIYKLWLSGPLKFEMIRTLPDITEDMGPREFVLAQIALANMTGRFLGYPECCVRSFVGHLMAGTDQDIEAMEELKKVKDPDPRAYFVERFVPCRPDCPDAIAEGERIEEALSEQAPDLLPDYLRLRHDHMEEVRSGAIVREKAMRDRALLGK